MLHIFVDADTCPVKPAVYRVAGLCRLPVTLVANTRMRLPREAGVTLQVVEGGLDAADDWIVNHVTPDDIVVTADILLADRCLRRGAQVIGPTGKPFTQDIIGQAAAIQNLLSDLRGAGETTSGPAPLTALDRSRFLKKLDDMIQAIRRRHPPIAT